jgi:hypothetical protein
VKELLGLRESQTSRRDKTFERNSPENVRVRLKEMPEWSRMMTRSNPFLYW